MLLEPTLKVTDCVYGLHFLESPGGHDDLSALPPLVTVRFYHLGSGPFGVKHQNVVFLKCFEHSACYQGIRGH